MRGFGKLFAGLAVAGAMLGLVPAKAEAQGSWGGLYIGASAGWMGSDIDWTYPNNSKPDAIEFDAGLLGGHVGIQTQWNQFVLGIEASFSGTGAFGGNDFSGGSCPNPAFSCEGRVANLFTVGPRLGWAPNNSWLLFVSGGYASGRIDTQTVNIASGNVFDTSHSRHDGWFFGGGVEYAIHPNVILGVEYQRVELDARNISASPFLATEVRNGLESEMDIVRARLSFKLGRPEEVHDSLK